MQVITKESKSKLYSQVKNEENGGGCESPKFQTAENAWLHALWVFLTATWKYLYFKDFMGISNHKTKPVEESQNSSDLYPTWYIKYERSAACMVGEDGGEVLHRADRDKVL